MPYQLILCIHGLIPLVQELDIGLPGLGIDPDYSIQTESVNAHVHPLFGRCNRGLESPGVLAIVRLSVIEVRHAAVETGPVRSGLAENDIHCLRIVQREGLAKGNHILAGFTAVLGAGRPGFIVGSTHQEAPVRIYIQGNLIDVVRRLVQAQAAFAANVDPSLGIGCIGRLGRLGGFRHRYIFGISRPVHLEVQTALIANLPVSKGYPAAHTANSL